MKIAVASGKGGTGKTLVSTNIYDTLIKNGTRAVLVDCDAEAPNSIAFFEAKLVSTSEVFHNVPVINTDKCTFCGKCHEYCNYNAIFILPPMKFIQVIEDLCHGCGACTVACEFDAITEKQVSLGQVKTFSQNGHISLIEAKMNIGVMSPVSIIKAAIKKVDILADIVILDSPPGTSCPFVQTVATADFVILVTEPTPFGLSDLRQSVETLKGMNKPYGVIINRAGLGNNQVQQYLEDEEILLLAEIPFDKKIAEYYSKGEIVSTKIPELKELLTGVVNQIIEKYGNSSN
ncbi:MAG: AAA family ATPase [Tenuifilaceae bacterium]